MNLSYTMFQTLIINNHNLFLDLFFATNDSSLQLHQIKI